MKTLISTKLFRPRVTSDLIRLARIEQALDHDLDRPVTLICAPAGYGKTTVLSSWLADTPRPQAWLSLDPGDDELVIFLSYLVAAIRTIFPDACPGIMALLEAADAPPQPALSAALANELDQLVESAVLPPGQRFILALDDYHLINNQEIHQTLDELLHHPPRSLHLILSTRHSPPLSLAPLRSRGQLVEIRAGALHFSADEIVTFLSKAVNDEVPPQAIAQIVTLSEGWVAALRFVALALNSERNKETSSFEFLADNRFAMDFLLNEVLERLPATTHALLLRTAILDRLCGSLCDALIDKSTSQQSGQQLLEWLEANNIFLIALDDVGQWYRYHHLFQELLHNQLKQRCTAQEIAALHSRASAWFAANDSIDAAIHHALAAGDGSTAAQLIETHRHTVMNQEDWPRLVRWLEMLPRELVEQRPQLLMQEAWYLQNRWRYADVPAHLSRIEALIEQTPLPEPDRTTLRSEMDLMYGRLSYWAADADNALKLVRRSRENAPMVHSFMRALGWTTYAAALQLQGNSSEMQAALQEGLKEANYHSAIFSAALLLTHTHLHLLLADLSAVKQGATHLLELSTAHNLPASVIWAHYFFGHAAYQLNDLATAEQAFSRAMRQRYIAPSYVFSQGAFGLALVYLAQGQGQQAWDLIDEVFAQGWETSSESMLTEVRAFRAYLSLRLGHFAEAANWAMSYRSIFPIVPQAPVHASYFTRIKILLALATEQSLHAAADLLAHVRDFAVRTFNTRMLIELHALQALYHDCRGEEAAALAALQESLRLAEPGGYLRVFIDLGGQLPPLIASLSKQSPASEFVKRIHESLSAAPPEELGSEPPQVGQPADLGAMPEPLTPRESEVLSLLAQHLTAKEVAEKLTLSPYTVKRHRANIYQKLGVNRLRDALAVAEAMDLLD